MSIDPQQPFLRTLAPLLRALEKQLRGWLDARRKYPITLIQRAEIEGIADDLKRKADGLDVERPLLVVMLMGGTGVGKSTLMNALAGASVAQASFTRPTTRDPVVYFHQTVKPDRLDPALRLCRLAQHDREPLMHKVIVDTPDVDSNDLANREKLQELLPVADVVIYVGSQEKYHDQLVWELFKEQRRRRAFAFVLNKWDRCVDAGTGLRPDEDLLKDLKAEGFDNPRLFRTTAQLWVDATKAGQAIPPDLPPGEQFRELVQWLEAGLTRLEIEAVKARGVGQLITSAESVIEGVKPPDLGVQAAKVRTAWEEVLNEEADAQADVLVSTLEPYQQEVEHHFTVRGQQNFWGLTAAYLRATTKLRYFTSTLRDRIPGVPKVTAGKVDTPTDWNLSEFVQNCSRTAGERVLTQRLSALSNKLLVEADQKGFPLALLSEPTAAVAGQKWEEKFTRGLVESLTEVEQEVTHPVGWRKWVRGGFILLCNTLPPVTLFSCFALVLYQYLVAGEKELNWVLLLLPLYATLGVLVLVQLAAAVGLPVRWPRIRGQFQERLREKLTGELGAVFLPVPDDIAAAVRDEKRQAEALVTETKQIADWLNEREQASQVGELYGK
ncbi:MAG: 50S ribosome-binding GTPase [Fimbriiglobus sp.]|nr:50S ribosome-binding GTPase [Fimbriiglobus sp.]